MKTEKQKIIMDKELSYIRRDETMTSLQNAEITDKQHKDVLDVCADQDRVSVCSHEVQ